MTQHAHVHGPGDGPEAKAKIEAMKRQWAQKKRIGERLGKIKVKMAVYSGKGGVGKSTVAVNLAVTLASQGSKVGLFDADIDCPNVLKLLKADDQPKMTDGKITPAMMHGVQVISMGLFQEKEDEAIIFRGPMIHNSLTQFIELTEWGEMDYLIVDMPPGTSDAALTIMQTLQLDGFVVVTTPQELAVLDARRSINMIRKLNLPVLGVVETMSGDIFGEGGGEQLAKSIDTAFLGSVHLNPVFRAPPAPPVLTDDKVRQQFDSIVSMLTASVAAPS